jgi:hypothetical protein
MYQAVVAQKHESLLTHQPPELPSSRYGKQQHGIEEHGEEEPAHRTARRFARVAFLHNAIIGLAREQDCRIASKNLCGHSVHPPMDTLSARHNGFIRKGALELNTVSNRNKQFAFGNRQRI